MATDFMQIDINFAIQLFQAAEQSRFGSLVIKSAIGSCIADGDLLLAFDWYYIGDSICNGKAQGSWPRFKKQRSRLRLIDAKSVHSKEQRFKDRWNQLQRLFSLS